MSTLPYSRGDGADPSSIPLESLRAEEQNPAGRSQSSVNSSNSNIIPPAHYSHQHSASNEHFYEGFEPGNQPASNDLKPDTTNSSPWGQYDTFVPSKHGGMYVDEKGAGSAHPRQQYEGDGDTSGDETEDFDWDTDEDNDTASATGRPGDKKIRAKRGRKAWLSIMQLARPFRILVFAVLGTAIALVPFIVVATAFQNSPARSQVEVWSIWIAIIWAAGCGTFLVLDWIPPLILKVGVAFYGKAPSMFKTYVEVLIATLIWSKLVLCVTWAWISLGGVLAIQYSKSNPRPAYFKWIFLVIQAVFASGIVLLAEKFALQLVAINFHKVCEYPLLYTILCQSLHTSYSAQGTPGR